MKSVVLILVLVFMGLSLSAQVLVNGMDINKEAEVITIYAFKKPFSTKECFFCDFGQDNFRLHYYDAKKQCIKDKDGRKFEKGEYVKLYTYLKSQGQEKIDEFEEMLGDIKGRAIMFERSKEKKDTTG